MKLLRRQTKKPSGSYASVVHIFLTALLPLLIFVMVRLGFGWIAVILVLLSKWRMFAVKSRHWPANIRSNAVDIFVGISIVIFMLSTDVQSIQLMWAMIYAGWLLLIKPLSTPLWIGVQALVGQMLALIASFYYWSDASTSFLIFVTWSITYLCARHFLAAFDENMSRATAYSWAFFSAGIAWLSGHWLIFYGPVAQPALLLTVLGYGLAAMYYLKHNDKLTNNVKVQFIAVMTMVVLFLIIFSDWSDKTI